MTTVIVQDDSNCGTKTMRILLWIIGIAALTIGGGFFFNYLTLAQPAASINNEDDFPWSVSPP